MLRFLSLVLFASLTFACSSVPSADEVCTLAEEKLCADDPGQPHAECVAEVEEIEKLAADSDCSSQYDDYIQCAADAFENQVVCDDRATDNADDFCQAKEDALEACVEKNEKS